MTQGGAVAEWSKALLVRENKQKSKRSQVCPPTWAPLKKITTCLTCSGWLIIFHVCAKLDLFKSLSSSNVSFFIVIYSMITLNKPVKSEMQWLPTPKAIPEGHLMLLLVSSKLRCGYHLLALVRGLKGINNWLVHCALVIADIEPRTLRS